MERQDFLDLRLGRSLEVRLSIPLPLCTFSGREGGSGEGNQPPSRAEHLWPGEILTAVEYLCPLGR